MIQESADSEANIIFGAGVDPALKDEVRITVIATGLKRLLSREGAEAQRRRRWPARSLRRGYRHVQPL